MIFAVAEAGVAEADSHHLAGAWSDLVVGDQPPGLVESYLLSEEGVWRVISVWDDIDSLNRALSEEGVHPANAVFDAVGVACRHTSMRVVGHLIPKDRRNRP
mgnify:FL=1